MNVYISDTSLRKYAEKIVENAKKATGYDGQVDIVDMDIYIDSSIYQSWTSTLTPTITTTQAYPLTGTTTTASTINFPYNSGGTTNVGSNYWQTTYPQTITAPQPTIGPVVVDAPPAKEHFEKMVSAQIQMLNEAYRLGREHGKLEGLKEGSEQITRTIDDIMDTEILQTKDEEPVSAV